MKKYVVALICFVMLLTLTGCGETRVFERVGDIPQITTTTEESATFEYVEDEISTEEAGAEPDGSEYEDDMGSADNSTEKNNSTGGGNTRPKPSVPKTSETTTRKRVETTVGGNDETESSTTERNDEEDTIVSTTAENSSAEDNVTDNVTESQPTE